MKEEKCCFYCRYCKPKDMKFICTYFVDEVELPIPFETGASCEYFECFQCHAHNKKHCWCYGDIEIKSEDIKVETSRPVDWIDNGEDTRWTVTVTHIDGGIKVSKTSAKGQKKAYNECIEDLKKILEEQGYEEPV